MRINLLCLSLISLVFFAGNAQTSREDIHLLLDRWHKAAAEANYDGYFELMANEAVFIGTDPTENWKKKEFMEWSKPYFDRGKAWNFSTLDRNIFLAEGENLAWFDELLDTQMGICRGSGVAVKVDGAWKIKHYVLSIAIPNEQVDAVTTQKEQFDRELIKKLKAQ